MRSLLLFLVLSPAIFHSCNEIEFYENTAFRRQAEAIIVDDFEDHIVEESSDSIGIPSDSYLTTKKKVFTSCSTPSTQNLSVSLPKSNPTGFLNLAASGEFCPQRVDQLHVLFLVDFSGSMDIHRDKPIDWSIDNPKLH